MIVFRKILTAFLFYAVICLLSSCQNGNQKIETPSDNALTTSMSASEENIVRNNQAAALFNRASVSLVEEEPFSSYTFEFNNYNDKYIITAALNEDSSQIVLTLEDNLFNFSVYNITAPDKYMLGVPYSQSYANQICTIIKNNINDTPVPEILQFDFYLSDYSDDIMPYKVSKFYSILNNKFTEIKLYDASKGSSEKMEYTGDTVLYHTEPLVFMPPPTVFEDENGRLSADVYTYTFNPENMSMIKNRADSSASNPLYYGYACHAIAGKVYRYFATDNLNVSDFQNYIEISGTNSENSTLYFKVDDPRFPDTDSLKDYVREYFSERITENMFLNAPQKYRDFNDELYTVFNNNAPDSSLGKLTFTGYTETETGSGSVVYHTKQEKLNETGALTGYAESGDFKVESDNNGETFIVTQYRFPNGIK